MRTPLRPGDPHVLGAYELLGRLGEGGMGAVFLGRDPAGRLVAVKVIKPEYAHEEEFRNRFRSEVKRARQVPPFCTAAVLDADPEHRSPYLVVEYVDGPSLDEVVEREGPLSGGRLHGVAVGVATALTAIHGAGVIHRDLKPRNVLFALGTPKVIDFGIARALEVTSQHTRPDQMVGTVAYMAPERFDGHHRDVTPAADVFAWGAVIAYAGTGRTPFRADSPVATAARILTQPPNLDGLTGSLRDLVELALAKDPENRPSAHELLTMLLAGNTDSQPSVQPALRRAAEAAQSSGRYASGGVGTAGTPARARPRRRWRRYTAAAAAAVLAAGLGAWSLGRIPGDAPPPYDAPAEPAPAPSAALPAMPVPGQVRGPWVVDALDRPGQWTAYQDADRVSRCRFDDGLVMTTTVSFDLQCPGPAHTFAGDQAVRATVTLGTARSCAVVRFREVGDTAYMLEMCPRSVTVRHIGAVRATTLGDAATSRFAPGERRAVVLTLRGDTADVTVDGTSVLRARLTDPSLLAGRVRFGLSVLTGGTDEDETGAAVVTDAEIRPVGDDPVPGSAAPSAAPKTFTDVRRGRSRSIVRVHGYDPRARSVVVEPVLFLTGDEYCAMFRITPSDGEAPCQRAWVTEDSRMTVTLPTTGSTRHTTADPERCLGEGVAIAPVGTCRAGAADFDRRIADAGGTLLAQLTAEDGTATALAEVYTP